MADDIIARLRVNAEGAPTKNGGHIWLSLSPSTSAEAADLLEAQQAEIERLRAAGDALATAFESAMRRAVLYDLDAALLVHEWAYIREHEARRG